MITAHPSHNTTQIKYAWNFRRTTILHDLYGLHVHTILNCLFSYISVHLPGYIICIMILSCQEF